MDLCPGRVQSKTVKLVFATSLLLISTQDIRNWSKDLEWLARNRDHVSGWYFCILLYPQSVAFVS